MMRLENAMHIDDVMRRAHRLEADHGPDGWPAIQMGDITIMRREILELRAKLNTQRAGVRDIIKAAVNLVCAPSWAGLSDEDCALEQALRRAGLVRQNAELTGSPALPASPVE